MFLNFRIGKYIHHIERHCKCTFHNEGQEFEVSKVSCWQNFALATGRRPCQTPFSSETVNLLWSIPSVLASFGHGRHQARKKLICWVTLTFCICCVYPNQRPQSRPEVAAIQLSPSVGRIGR